jgi:hypothetical protein
MAKQLTELFQGSLPFKSRRELGSEHKHNKPAGNGIFLKDADITEPPDAVAKSKAETNTDFIEDRPINRTQQVS